MAIYRSATFLMTAVMILLVSIYARAQTGRSDGTFPKAAETMNPNYAKPHVGIIAGITNPEASFATRMEYGLDVGFQPWSPFGLGLEVTGLNSDRTLGSQPQDLNRTNILLKGTYNMGGNIPVVRNSYVGLGLGAVIDSSAYKGTHSGVAPILGFDIPLGSARENYFSLGAAAKYVFVSGPSPDSYTLNGMAKYWF